MPNSLIRPTDIGLNQHPSPFIEVISAYHTHAGKGYFHPAPKGNSNRPKDCFVFYRSMQGEGLLQTRSGDFPLAKHDVAIVRNAEKIALSANSEWRYFSVFFYAENLRLPVNTLLSLPLIEGEEETLEKMISLFQSGGFLDGAKASALFQTLLCDILSAMKDSAKKQDTSPYAKSMRETAQYIKDNLAEDLSVETLAKRCSFSKNHFCNVFKRYFSITPKAYVLRAKLEKARLLLTGTDMPVADVAEALCFYSPAHFAFSFKKQYGMTPLQYREKR